MAEKLRIYIVDDHTLFREGLKFLLSKSELISEIHEASNGIEILKNISTIDPDIILMDIEMPELNGIDATKEILELMPDAKIIALSMYSDEIYYSEMIEAGAKGFLLKNSKFEDVMKAIFEVNEGNNYFSPEILDAIIKNMNKKIKPKVKTGLTKREIDILYNICKGFSNQEIANNQYLSKRTVDKHRENILIKTESKNTAGLVIYAIKNGIFKV